MADVNNGLRYNNIHFSGCDDRFKSAILEFVALKFFFRGIRNDESSFIEGEIKKLEGECAAPLVYTYKTGDPEEDISSSVGRNHRIREVKKERTLFKERLAFYR